MQCCNLLIWPIITYVPCPFKREATCGSPAFSLAVYFCGVGPSSGETASLSSPHPFSPFPPSPLLPLHNPLNKLFTQALFLWCICLSPTMVSHLQREPLRPWVTHTAPRGTGLRSPSLILIKKPADYYAQY